MATTEEIRADLAEIVNEVAGVDADDVQLREVLRRRPRRRLALHGRGRRGRRGEVRRHDPRRRGQEPQDRRRRRRLHRAPRADALPDVTGAARPAPVTTDLPLTPARNGTHHALDPRSRHRPRCHLPRRRGRRLDLAGPARRHVRRRLPRRRLGRRPSRSRSAAGWPSSRPRCSTGSRRAAWTAPARSRVVAAEEAWADSGLEGSGSSPSASPS